MPKDTKVTSNKFRALDSYLVALDVVGFSKQMDVAQFASHRMALMRAIKKTWLFDEATKKNFVDVHFLGDELRMRFLTDECSAIEIREFVENVIENLEDFNKDLESEEGQTNVKGVILSGKVSVDDWCEQKCEFLDGQLTLKAQDWSGKLDKNQVGIDDAFKRGLEHGKHPTSHLKYIEYDSKPKEYIYILFGDKMKIPSIK